MSSTHLEAPKPYFKLSLRLDLNEWKLIYCPSYLRSMLFLEYGRWQLRLPLTLAQCIDATWNVRYVRYRSVACRSLAFGPFSLMCWRKKREANIA